MAKAKAAKSKPVATYGSLMAALIYARDQRRVPAHARRLAQALANCAPAFARGILVKIPQPHRRMVRRALTEMDRRDLAALR